MITRSLDIGRFKLKAVGGGFQDFDGFNEEADIGVNRDRFAVSAKADVYVDDFRVFEKFSFLSALQYI